MDEPSPRTWTPATAEAALPRVRAVVERARALYATYAAEQRKARRAVAVVRQNGHGVVPADPTALRECVEVLAAEGIVLRDVERGLVDFPAVSPSGRSYWLCWLPDEDHVGWWHWEETGFAGRTPLSDPPP